MCHLLLVQVQHLSMYRYLGDWVQPRKGCGRDVRHTQASKLKCKRGLMPCPPRGKESRCQLYREECFQRWDTQIGGWQGNVHDEVYRTEQSIKTLLAASGLRPQPNASEGGKYLYSIPRQRAKPPTELQEMIFPFVTNELAEVRQVN